MLRDEMIALRDGRASVRQFVELRALVARTISRTPQAGDPSAVDELVASFLASLAMRGKDRGVAGVLEPLLAGGDDALEASVRRILWELAAETGPQWLLVKSLREHVAIALENLPPAPPAPPSDLTEASRLSSRLVALACAWLLAQPNPPRRERRELAKTLQERYFATHPVEGGATPAEPGDGPDELVRRHRDAYWIADRLVEELGPSLSSTLMHRLAGESLEEIARADGCAVATVHGRLERARKLITPLVLRYASERTAELALEELARRAARRLRPRPGPDARR